MNKIDYSIIIPVYYNEGSLLITFHRIFEKVISRNKNYSCEVIFIDDGSKDNSLKELKDLKGKYPEYIKIIKFTRNFGQVAAISAGYQFAKGDCIINLSADLQDPPELINQMLDFHFKENYNIVICARNSREDSLFRSKTSLMFYKIISKLCFSNMPTGGFDFVLISKKVRNILLERNETNSFWQGQILWTGYEPKFIYYQRLKREIGESKWGFSKKIKYLIDGILSYSYFPIRLMSILGGIIALTGFAYAIVILFARIFGNIPFKGYAPIVILILVLSGFQMLMIGIIGEYLWRTIDQVRNRLPYIIEDIYE